MGVKQERTRGGVGWNLPGGGTAGAEEGAAEAAELGEDGAAALDGATTAELEGDEIAGNLGADDEGATELGMDLLLEG